MAVTQKFIAEKAQISQKTVSQYFKGTARISAATRARLDRIVEQYGYFPNLAARTMKTKRFNRIACLLIYNTSSLTRGFLAPHMLNYVNAAAVELSKHGYALVIEPFKVDADRQVMLDSPDSFATLSVDGILGIAGGWVPSEIDGIIDKMGIPSVWLNRPPPGLDQVSINFDETPGIRELADHLLSLGKSRIAWFGPDFAHLNAHHSAKTRYETLKAELARHQQECFRPVFNRKGHTLCPPALELFNGPELPDAVVSYNLGFREAAEQAALYSNQRPGYDFQSVHFASSWEFSPTTHDLRTVVMLPEEEVGKDGALYLYERIQGNDPSPPQGQATWLHVGRPFAENR
jgi:LacI family transcriptional regulator